MVLYNIVRDNGERIALKVVESVSWGGEQGTIIYEAPGRNGGIVLTTGRKIRKLSFSGRILGSDLVEVEKIKQKIEKIRDDGEVVTLDFPLNTTESGRYIISNFEGQLPPGQGNYVTFTIEFTEYGQANIRQAAINLVNFQPAEILKQRARERNILA